MQCKKCLQNAFESQLNIGTGNIDVICVKCPESSQTQYCCCDGNIDKFLQVNFTLDYSTLAFIYKNCDRPTLQAWEHVFQQTIGKEEYKKICVDNKEEQILVDFALDDTKVLNSEESDELNSEENEGRKLEIPVMHIIPRKRDVMGPHPENPSKVFIEKFSDTQEKVSVGPISFSEEIPNEFLCLYCRRLFNKRNVPILFKCGHNQCENCTVKYCRILTNSNDTVKYTRIAEIGCKCGSGRTKVKMQVPQYFPMNFIIRKICKINTDLLERIRNKINAYEKTAQYEFDTRRIPRNSLLEVRMCCHQCKESLQGETPYLLACGHSTCLKCAFISLQSNISNEHKSIIKCSIDNIETNIRSNIIKKETLKTVLQKNTHLIEYFQSACDETPEEPVKNENECPICLSEFDKEQIKPMIVCRKHFGSIVCLECLKMLIQREIDKTSKGLPLTLISPICQCPIIFPAYDKTNLAAEFLKQFQPKL